ncbi:hypothetical protein AYO29_06470 [Coxiella burnetii str. Schperling]|nr:hypothetical protein A35_06605 [Coxiella burnetii 'MSU Goat Q177']ATN86108.1 hypothetical protein AYO29_06470 [Coxiella burnetii str. Schperling]PHH57118.1 hypothetical protein CRH12_07215 [Coxiella burnetii]
MSPQKFQLKKVSVRPALESNCCPPRGWNSRTFSDTLQCEGYISGQKAVSGHLYDAFATPAIKIVTKQVLIIVFFI